IVRGQCAVAVLVKDFAVSGVGTGRTYHIVLSGASTHRGTHIRTPDGDLTHLANTQPVWRKSAAVLAQVVVLNVDAIQRDIQVSAAQSVHDSIVAVTDR